MIFFSHIDKWFIVHYSTHPEAKLHGFDSFGGLPEAGGPWEKGDFDTSGEIPRIDDSRVRFFNGWFNDVLPTYSVPEHEVLVVNMDADLYSSTIYVLRQLRPYFRPGTFIYFDEISQVEHEARAFEEFLTESGFKFESFAADATLAFSAFRCVETPAH